MTLSASATTSRLLIGKQLSHLAIRLGRRVKLLESRVLHSQTLAVVPLKYRQIGFQGLKLILMLLVAGVATFLAVGMIALWVFSALPITSSDDEPGAFDVSHPRHRFKFPEMYDDHGSLR